MFWKKYKLVCWQFEHRRIVSVSTFMHVCVCVCVCFSVLPTCITEDLITYLAKYSVIFF